ncbi:MAG: FAD-dependent monooxygenase [Pseudomonadota bacterium]
MKTEVLIIGGGVPGLTLALLLGQKGIETCVVDTEKVIPLNEVELTGRTSALWAESIELLKSARVWDAVESYTEPLRALRIIDDSSKVMDPVQVDFESREIGLEVFGYNTPNAKLRAALVEEISKFEKIMHIAPARLHDYTATPSKIIARLEGKTEIEANLIIGADGRNSVTRHMAGIEVSKQDYGQSALTCVIDHTLDHGGISTEHHRPGGPFTTVPMPNKQSAIVWMEKTEDAERFIKLEKQHFEQALQERTRDSLGKVTLATNPECWPIITQNAKALTAPRCALMAEAAHVMSPIGAQGLNLSLRDVRSLANVIIKAMSVGEDPGSATVLQKYARERKADVDTRVNGIDLFNRLVSNNKSSLRGLRRMGLKTLDTLPMLKEFTMMQGLTPQSFHNAGKR